LLSWAEKKGLPARRPSSDTLPGEEKPEELPGPAGLASDPTQGVHVIIMIQLPSPQSDQSEPVLFSSFCLLYSQASFVPKTIEGNGGYGIQGPGPECCMVSVKVHPCALASPSYKKKKTVQDSSVSKSFLGMLLGYEIPDQLF
jgi:hypothetical protein